MQTSEDLADGYYLMTNADPSQKEPVQIFTFTSDGETYRHVRGYQLNWSLASLLKLGATFVRLMPVEMPTPESK